MERYFLLSGHLTFSLRTLVEHDDADVQPVYVGKDVPTRNNFQSHRLWKLFRTFVFPSLQEGKPIYLHAIGM